jgi:recombination protein RecA
MPRKTKEELSLDEKKERLLKLMNEKNREYKDPQFLKFAKDEPEPTRTLFGLKELDELTGGVPSKRFSIIWGPKSAGKSTLANMLISQAQKNHKICALIDLEKAYDKKRAELFGVNVDDLVIGNAFDNAEQAMDTLIAMCKEKAIDFIVIDSIQALSPKGEQETKKGKLKSVEDDEMALLARKLSKFFRVSASGVYKGDVTIILIGQTRMDIGGFIALETLSGGHALQHWSTMTLQIRRGPKAESPTEKIVLEETDEEGKPIKVERIIGFQAIIKLEKIKISGAKMEGSDIRLPFFFEKGFKSGIDYEQETK